MSSRDPRTGRFVATSNTPESAEGKFGTYSDLPVEIQGADPAELAYDTVPRSPLRARNTTLVHPDDEGHHNAILRTAARSAGPMDSSPFLTGLVGHPAPSMGVQGTRVEVHGDHNPLSPGADLLRQPPGRTPGRVHMVTDDEPMGTPGGDLRPASRGLGRGRDR
jgi:hypothetical protein